MGKQVGDHAITASTLYGRSDEPTYSGVLSFMRRTYSKDLTGVDVAVTGIPLDLATTHRPGARFGPAAIRKASAQLAWGPPWPYRFDPFAKLAVIDYGDCILDHGRPETIDSTIREHARSILAGGAFMLALGGDHYITYPLLQAHAEIHGPLALVHFDSHADTWGRGAARLDHGVMFARAADENLISPERSVQIGIRTQAEEDYGFTVIPAAEAMRQGAEATAAAIMEVVAGSKAYLTFDLDCLDPAYAPGVGTPVVGGLSSMTALQIISALAELDFVGMDVVEVCPPYDVSEITALAAASVAAQFLCLLATRKEGRNRN